jgi:hypothetical protein
VLYSSREGLQMVDRLLQFLHLCLAAREGLGVGFELCQAILCSMNSRLEFFPFQKPFLVGVDQPSDPSSHAADQPRELIDTPSRLLASTLQTTLELTAYPIRI